MKILKYLNLAFYAFILTFTMLVPNEAMAVGFFKFGLFLATLGAFIFLTSIYAMLSYNRTFSGLKKYLYSDIVLMLFGIFVTVQIGHEIYKMTGNLIIMYLLFGVTWLTSLFFQYKIKAILKDHEFDFMEEVRKFFKMGKALEGTPLWTPINRLDNFMIIYAVAVGISLQQLEWRLYIVAVVTALVLLLSIKYIPVVKQEFLASGLISGKEVNIAVTMYFFCYLASVAWIYFIPNMSVILVAGTAPLGIKLLSQRIAIKLYDEKNAQS